MRFNKFRVWDKRNKRMSWSFGLGVNKLTFDTEPGYCDEYSFDDLILEELQYTGIKDKNGVEICEGDIWLEDGLPQVVEMIDGCWQSVGRTSDGDIYDKITFDLIDFRYKEVIGNIYENANLLKEMEV